ncbi:MAG: HAMP domain-containing protein [Deinococcales bacterium]
MFGQATEPTLVRAAPITTGGQAIGAVVVGVPPISADKSLVTAFEMVLLVGLVPLLLGILMASGLTGGLRRKVQYLLQAADRISRGDLDEPVSLQSRDELGQLARAIERMRVSLSTLLEHRRRHR